MAAELTIYTVDKVEDCLGECAIAVPALPGKQVARFARRTESLSLEGLLRRRYLPFVVLAIITGATFLNSLSGGFVYDDLTQELRNHSFGNWGPDELKYIVTHDFWSAVAGENKLNTIDSGYYRPFLNIALMSAYEFAGYSAFKWHLLVLLMHIGSIAILFLLLEESLSRIGLGQRKRRLMSLTACLIFAVHPVQSESVAWISDIGNPLIGLLVFSSFTFFLWFRRFNQARYLFASVFLFTLAAFSKENAVAMIPILIGCEAFVFAQPGGDGSEGKEGIQRTVGVWQNRLLKIRMALIYSIPFVLVEAVYLVFRRNALGALMVRFNSGNFPDDVSLTLVDNLRTLPSLLLAYIKLVVFPFNLSAVYDFSYVKTFSIERFWIPLVLTVLIVGLLFHLCSRQPVVRLALLWFLPLFPHLRTTTFPSELIIEDHYLYLSSVGFGLLAAWFLFTVRERLTTSKLKTGFGYACAFLIVTLAALTVRQNRTWTNEITFWENAAAHAPRSRLVHLELGRLAEERGDQASALSHYSSALEVNPDLIDALNNTAFVLSRQGRWKVATNYFERIVELTPAMPVAHFNLSVAYAAGGRRLDATAELQKAIELEPQGRRLDEWKIGLYILQTGKRPNAPASGVAQLAP